MHALTALMLSSFISVLYGAPSKPKARAVGFAADPSINAKGVFAAAKASLKAGKDVLATFPSTEGVPNNVKILGDWENLPGISAIHFIADMDVDCDGVDFRCPHNPDGQPQTNFGHLDARKVPWYVIPDSFFHRESSKIKPNSLGVVICNGKAFYGIFGDSAGATPQVIGEASLLMAQTCFPSEGLDGGTGHSSLDVLYIIIGDKVPPGVRDKTIDIAALKKLGDLQFSLLAKALGV